MIRSPWRPTSVQHPFVVSLAIGSTELLRWHTSGPYSVRSAVSEAKTRIMTSSESEQTQTSRKRSRRGDSGDDGGAGGKKARGRPRVDTQDATAADVSGDATSFLLYLPRFVVVNSWSGMVNGTCAPVLDEEAVRLLMCSQARPTVSSSSSSPPPVNDADEPAALQMTLSSMEPLAIRSQHTCRMY